MAWGRKEPGYVSATKILSLFARNIPISELEWWNMSTAMLYFALW